MSRTGFPLSEWTYSEYARLPDDGNRYEVIDGEVCVTPAPGLPHQRVAAKLFRHLSAYVEANELGEVLWDVDVLFVSGQYLRPDMVFVPRDAILTDRGVESAPGLVVEVLSPHSALIDRVKKPPRPRYRDFGIPEYWVVDQQARAVEVYRLREGIIEPDVRTDRLVWQPVAHAPVLELEVQKLF
jgi:Uma2 family endonuclease